MPIKSSYSLRYGFGSSRDLHAKLGRERQNLQNAIESQDNLLIADEIFNFCVTGHSLKDWIGHENNDLKNAVEEFVNTKQELTICADICNSSKHKVLTKRIRSRSTGSIQDSEITADMTTISADSTIPINGYTVRILLDDGFQIEILHFSNQVYDAWEMFLNKNGL